MEFSAKHVVKIQVGILLTVVGSIVYWSMTAQAYFSKVDNHETRIATVEQKLDRVATKDDIQVLKTDLKDYINKK